MLETRRRLIFALAGTTGLLSAARLLPARAGQYPPPRPTPAGPSNPVSPGGSSKPSAPRPLSPKNQELLKSDLDQITELASELKTEYQSTNTTLVLSVSFVKKAEQLEKLAKKVKDLAKG